MPATPPHASAAADRSPLDGLVGGDLLSSADLTPAQTRALLTLAADLKAGRRRIDLGGKVLGLIFSKASTRTRVSFTVAMARLGGQTIDLLPIVTQVGRGEPVAEPLLRCPGHPHLRPGRSGGLRPLGLDPGDQCPHRPGAPLPGPG
jgi:ornithine carbamoyltransferase